MMVHSLFTFFLVLMQVHHVPEWNSPSFHRPCFFRAVQYWTDCSGVRRV